VKSQAARALDRLRSTAGEACASEVGIDD
jgi:hypothetical protein